MQLHHDDPALIWVNETVAAGRGTYEQPYPSIEEAMERVQPGETIVLQSGEYTTDSTIQKSGTIHKPISICAENEGAAVVKSSCWFFYDTSDLIVIGITFADAPYGAISVIGECNRNRFASLRFINCGTRKKTAGTLYFGGAGGRCNIVENCSFEHALSDSSHKVTADTAAIGLMIAQGNPDEGKPIVDNLIRRNRFVNYEYGIVLGGDRSHSERCGHIIEYNTVRNCTFEGMLVNSGDTIVRGNCIEGCTGDGLAVHAALDCTIEENRIVDCRSGVTVHGVGHTIANNCLVRCSEGAIRVGSASEREGSAATNCFIERNTMVDCSSSNSKERQSVAGIIIESGTSGIIQRNLICGAGRPYAVTQPEVHPADAANPDTRFIIKDNGADGESDLPEGVGTVTVAFTDSKSDDYTNSSGFGAEGWMLTPAGFDPDIDATDGDIDYRAASVHEDENGNTILPDRDGLDRERLFENFYSEIRQEDRQVDDGDSAALLSDDG